MIFLHWHAVFLLGQTRYAISQVMKSNDIYMDTTSNYTVVLWLKDTHKKVLKLKGSFHYSEFSMLNKKNGSYKLSNTLEVTIHQRDILMLNNKMVPRNFQKCHLHLSFGVLSLEGHCICVISLVCLLISHQITNYGEILATHEPWRNISIIRRPRKDLKKT